MRAKKRLTETQIPGSWNWLTALRTYLKRGGLLCAIRFSASVQAQRRMLSIVMEIARLYL